MLFKEWILTLAISLVLQANGLARIGETRIECIERYGPEIKKGAILKKIPTANWSRFQSGKFILDFALVEMQAVGVSYSSTSTLLSASDTLHILAAEGNGWLPFCRRWFKSGIIVGAKVDSGFQRE